MVKRSGVAREHFYVDALVDAFIIVVHNSFRFRARGVAEEAVGRRRV